MRVPVPRSTSTSSASDGVSSGVNATGGTFSTFRRISVTASGLFVFFTRIVTVSASFVPFSETR